MITRLKEYFLKKFFKIIYPPGHYYSTIPDLKEITLHERSIFKPVSQIDGINLNKEEQIRYLRRIKEIINEHDFPSVKTATDRYYSTNSFFVLGDALYYQAIIKDVKPRKIIEVGSGFSSAVMLDTLDSIKHETKIDLIEPYPDRLLSLLRREDETRFTLHKSRVQDIDISLFKSLEANDILFIDSSHVSKVGSDLNFLLFEVLPVLRPGVIIHFHDITFPFEYPKDWIFKGRYWNEVYLVRAFLLYNDKFSIFIFNSYLTKMAKEILDEIDSRLTRGGSLWLKKN